MISGLDIAFTLLVRDWHEIDQADKDAVATLNKCKAFPEWALSLKHKYIDEKAASEEALDLALQVIKDRVERKKNIGG